MKAKRFAVSAILLKGADGKLMLAIVDNVANRDEAVGAYMVSMQKEMPGYTVGATAALEVLD